MVRFLAPLSALALVGAAAASHGEPKKQIKSADQARAVAMQLRKSDFGPRFKMSKPSAQEPHFYCKAVDESDLVISAEAESALFTFAGDDRVHTANSGSWIYRTAAQSAESWRRSVSPAGVKCVERFLRQEVKRAGATLVSVERLRGVAPQSFGMRVRARAGFPLTFDLLAMRHGRAQSALFFGGALVAFPRKDEERLASIVADRMADLLR